MNSIFVAPGECIVSEDTGVILQACLGSCVGVCLYDSSTRMAGLLHILLSDSHKIKDVGLLCKYADTGIPMTVQKMMDSGSKKENIVAKLAGGALIRTNKEYGLIYNIGSKNSSSAIKKLGEESIPVASLDLGGHFGRVIQLHVSTGKTLIRRIGEKDRVL